MGLLNGGWAGALPAARERRCRRGWMADLKQLSQADRGFIEGILQEFANRHGGTSCVQIGIESRNAIS